MSRIRIVGLIGTMLLAGFVGMWLQVQLREAWADWAFLRAARVQAVQWMLAQPPPPEATR